MEDVKAKTKELSEMMQKIGAELYKTTPPNASDNKGGSQAEGPDKVGNEPKADEGEFKEKQN